MITELTQEQTSKLKEYKDKWLKIGLSCEPLDFENAKIAVCKAYELAGLEHPKFFYRFQSPVSAAIGSYILRTKFQVRDQVEEQVWGRVREQVWSQVKEQVKEKVWSQVKEKVWGQVWSQVKEKLWDQVWSQVLFQVREKVFDQVEEQVRGQLREQTYGNHDASWLGFYEFFRNELHIEECKKLDGLIDLAHHCGWWAPYKNIVILQDRPEYIKFDNENRLHSEIGPAIKYRDGFSVYAWHGVRIPSDWINGNLPNVSTLLNWDNIEQRRCGCEILGWDKILQEINATVIDANSNPQIGILLEADIPQSGKERFLKVNCGTGREFIIPVPPECKTAHEANAWTYGIEKEQLKPEVRT